MPHTVADSTARRAVSSSSPRGAPRTHAGVNAAPVAAAATTASLQLLGMPRLRGPAGEEVRLTYRKGWAVLAWLVLQPAQPQRRAQLAELLWPRLSEAAALINLRQVLCDLNQKLGRLLGASPLACDRHTVRWCAPARLQVDVLAVLAGTVATENAAPAGELLDGLVLDDCEEFTAWLRTLRTRLGRERDRVLEQRRDALAQVGRIDDALAVAQRLAEADPWNEARCRAWMRMLALAGEHQRAIEAYEDLALALREELGVEPQPESRAMYLGIRASQRACELALRDHER